MAVEQQTFATKDSLDILQKELERIKKALKRKESQAGINADWIRWILTLLVSVTVAVMGGVLYQVQTLRTELAQTKAELKIEMNEQSSSLRSDVKDALLQISKENQKEFADIKAILECVRKGK